MSRLQYWVNLVKGTGVTGGNNLRLWDQLSLDGNLFPGLAQVEPDTQYGFDTGTTKTPESKPDDPRFKTWLTFRGYKAATIKANIMIWDPVDWAVFQNIMNKIRPKKDTLRLTPMSISHPSCDLLGIDKVSIVGVGVPQIVEQTLTVKLSMIQWFAPMPILDTFQTTDTNTVPKSANNLK